MNPNAYVWEEPKSTHHALESEMRKSLWAKLSKWPRHEFPVQLKQVYNGLFVSSLLPCSALLPPKGKSRSDGADEQKDPSTCCIEYSWKWPVAVKLYLVLVPIQDYRNLPSAEVLAKHVLAYGLHPHVKLHPKTPGHKIQFTPT